MDDRKRIRVKPAPAVVKVLFVKLAEGVKRDLNRIEGCSGSCSGNGSGILRVYSRSRRRSRSNSSSSLVLKFFNKTLSNAK